MQTVSETILEWSSSATIHQQLNWQLSAADSVDCFPESMQPLASFIFEQQDVIKSPSALNELKQWILLQSLYYYCQKTATNKLDIVSDACAKIVADGDGIFSNEQKQIASSIIVDEGYHSFSCMAIRSKIVQLNKIQFVKLPDTTTTLMEKIQQAVALIDPKNIDAFNLVVAGLVKATMSSEVNLNLEEQENSALSDSVYYRLQKSRQSDETRHLCFFLDILELYWQQLHVNIKADIMPAIQLFVESYNHGFCHFGNEFIARLLIPLSVSKNMLDNALQYIRHKEADFNSKIYTSMLSLLNQSKILS